MTVVPEPAGPDTPALAGPVLESGPADGPALASEPTVGPVLASEPTVGPVLASEPTDGSAVESGPTGHPAVDAALADLDAVAEAEPARQVGAYEQAHRALSQTLAAIDQS